MFDDPRDVLLAPVISEKSYGLLDANKVGSVDDVPPERAARIELPSDVRSPEALTEVRQSATALSRVLATLPSDEATVLILARLEGLSYDDIASILGRSATATKQLAYRALKRVRMQLVAEGYGDDL